jgi:hypothetical protein
MALWGTADSLYSVGTVTINYGAKTITGTGTSFTAAGISAGDVIAIGAGGTFGSAVISGITSDRLISIATTQYLSGAPTVTGVAYSISEKPVYTLEDSNYSSNVVGLTSTTPKHNVYGVDQYEIGLLSPGASGIATQYGGIHAGWVGIHTYIDMHGYLRVKSETLVAMSEISSGSASYSSSGDADDDAVLADAIITITSQPASVGVGTTATATFSVTASITPSNAPISYQWQQDPNTGTFAILSGQTSRTVSVANTNTSKNNYKYRVVITSGDASVTSGIATMTVS